jgi:predicted TIM-barrel fold metal-dependent hydrolase
MHIYDPVRFQMPPSKRVPPSDATVAHYRELQKRIGTTCTVVVQPRNYAIDNRVTLDAIAQLGADARGVAVLQPSVTDAELKALDAGGIRGIRFTLGDPATAVVKVDMIEPLAKRVVELGWHIQFNVEGAQVVELADIFRRLPTQMVFDHLGNPTLPAGIDHASHAILRDLVDKGRTWVKLSGAYSNSKSGPPYPDATRTARAWVAAAPERLVWGSDWPHPTEQSKQLPDDAVLFDLLIDWVPDEKVRHRVLVENPAVLYDFPKGV